MSFGSGEFFFKKRRKKERKRKKRKENCEKMLASVLSREMQTTAEKAAIESHGLPSGPNSPDY